jgi:hypothetical protein
MEKRGCGFLLSSFSLGVDIMNLICYGVISVSSELRPQVHASRALSCEGCPGSSRGAITPRECLGHYHTHRGRTPSNTRHPPRCTRLVRRSRPDTFHPPGRSWRKGEFDRKAGSPLPVSTRRVFVLSVLSVSANPNTARVESYQRVPWAKPDQPEPKLGTSGPIPPALV